MKRAEAATNEYCYDSIRQRGTPGVRSASGPNHSQTLSGIPLGGDQPRRTGAGTPEFLQLVVPAGQVEVIDTWHALGMRGTDSNDVSVEDVLVPRSRVFAMAPEFEPGPHYQGSLYRFPGMGTVVTIFTPVLLAIGRGAIDAFRELALEKTPLGYARKLRERGVVQSTFARAEGMLRAATVLVSSVRRLFS